MKAAVVHDFARPPRFDDFAAPEPKEGEVIVHVKAAALSQLVKAQASGKHYSSPRQPPFVPGSDGVGLLDSGQRVYFAFPSPPFGSLAQQTAVQRDSYIALPDDVDDLTAAAIANPGMSSWAALKYRAQFRAGESVLINGATGVSGGLAVQIARLMGAGHVVVTGRDPQALDALRQSGADHAISVADTGEGLTDRFREALHDYQIGVILDYVWGPSAERLIGAFAGHNAAPEDQQVRYVQIGSMGGADITLPGAILRSSGLKLLGSGIGSVSDAHLLEAIAGVMTAASRGQVSIETEARPLQEVENAWMVKGDARMVITI